MRPIPLMLCALCLAAAPATQPTYEPTSRYVKQDIEGWTVHVHQSLLGDHKALGDEAVKFTRSCLYNVTRVVPAEVLPRLRQVPIWLEYNNPKVALGCYHPSRRWLIDNGFNPEKANSIEIGNAKRLLDPHWTHHQPWMFLHELAHAYHFRHLGENPELKAAFRRAKDAGLYASVLLHNGKKVKHYALTNDKEFFAELTESYFGVNDFYPFVRAELLEYDKESHDLIAKLWGVKR